MDDLNLDSLYKKASEDMSQSIRTLKDHLKKVRTGKAQVSMLDSIKVDYYGNMTPLNQVASVSCPDPRSFLIAPWEVKSLKDIETAIVRSNVGMTPQNDGKIIRLKIPELTEEHRKDLVKKIRKIIEDARVYIRKIRRDFNQAVKNSLKDKIISEDESKRRMDEAQDLTDQFIKQVNDIGLEKEEELMKV